jgi:hypothetical protein
VNAVLQFVCAILVDNADLDFVYLGPDFLFELMEIRPNVLKTARNHLGESIAHSLARAGKKELLEKLLELHPEMKT